MQYKVTFSDIGTITIDAGTPDEAAKKAMIWAEAVLKKSVLAVTELTVSTESTFRCA